MLKMTIDNEEVLSNNDISIKEEILSPSSTILNNVYPKTWEQDKDYTSRFYYPKDYSKLNIQNFSVEPEEAGTTIQVNGNATLTDVDTTKESRVLRVLGQTSQTQYTGKNLFYVAPQTLNGVTLSYASDGAIVLNGTSTASFTAFKTATSLNGAYNLNVSNSTIQANTYVRTRTSANVLNHDIALSNTNFKQQNKTGEVAYCEITCGASGVTYNNFKIYIQLEAGSSATSFEPYVGGTASPNPNYPQPVNVVSGDNTIDICGKNLVGTTNVSSTTTNGITYSITGDTITINGTATANTTIMTTTNFALNQNTTYNLSFITVNGTKDSTFMGLRFRKNGSQVAFIQTNTTTSKSMDLTNIDDVQLYIISGTVFNNYSFKFQLEKGSTATTYEPYIGNSYPIYLGTYIPTEYTPVEYIQSSGTQYIDTGFEPNQNTRIFIDFTPLNTTGSFVFGARKGTNDNAITLVMGANLRSDYAAQQHSYTQETNSRYKFDRNKNVDTIYKNDVLFTTHTFTSVSSLLPNCNLFIFNNSTNGTAGAGSSIKLYSCKIYDNGTLVRHFVPCYRNSDNVIGLYDAQNGGFYTNQGTGAFTKGNDIPNGIELCKIGTYQDYIYKDNGSWYLHKEIGKVVLDGSENWGIRTDVVQTGYTCFMNGSYVVNSRYTNSNITNVYCNYFVVLAQYTGQPMIRIINVNGYGETVMFPSSIASTEANFKTWLSSHNTILYYVLPTPTAYEITDTTLLEQLESLSS